MAVAEVAVRGPAPLYRVHDYDLPALPGGVHRGLPSPWLTLVVSLAGPVTVQVPAAAGAVRVARQGVVGGLFRQAVTLPQDGPQRGVQLDVHPLVARTLLGLPAGELGGLVVGLEEVLGRGGERLGDRLAAARDAAERAAVVHRWAVQRISAHPARGVRAEVREAWRLILRSGGRARVGDVAAEVGWGRRHLAAHLRAEAGLATKDLARVTRFARSARLLRRPEQPRLVDVAATCGYTDQSHLTHEWRDLAGCTPRQWIAEELAHLGPILPRPAGS